MAQSNKSEQARRIIQDTLNDQKAQEIEVISLKGKTDIADYAIIASGTSNRHVMTIADYVVQNLKKEGIMPWGVEGKDTGDWVIVDVGGVIVHLFLPAVRQYYDLDSFLKNMEKAREAQQSSLEDAEL